MVNLDLASLASIRQTAAAILQDNDRLDILINNAGLFTTKYAQTADGFELTYGVNYLGALSVYLAAA